MIYARRRLRPPPLKGGTQFIGAGFIAQRSSDAHLKIIFRVIGDYCVLWPGNVG
jgi:hypothetical protein